MKRPFRKMTPAQRAREHITQLGRHAGRMTLERRRRQQQLTAQGDIHALYSEGFIDRDTYEKALAQYAESLKAEDSEANRGENSSEQYFEEVDYFEEEHDFEEDI